MLLSILWTENGITYPQRAKDKMRELIEKETDIDIIKSLSETALGEILEEELYIRIRFAEEEDKKTWVEEVCAYYNELIDTVESTLDSREVTTLPLTGNVVGFVTGGMTWGDPPTEAMSHWSEVFYEYEDELLGNPYARQIGKAYGLLSPNKESEPGQKRISVQIKY